MGETLKGTQVCRTLVLASINVPSNMAAVIDEPYFLSSEGKRNLPCEILIKKEFQVVPL